jgi:hypothetical protein
MQFQIGLTFSIKSCTKFDFKLTYEDEKILKALVEE